MKSVRREVYGAERLGAEGNQAWSLETGIPAERVWNQAAHPVNLQVKVLVRNQVSMGYRAYGIKSK